MSFKVLPLLSRISLLAVVTWRHHLVMLLWFNSRAWLTSHCPSVLWHCWLGHISLTRKIVSEMTYIVSSGTLNPTIPYHSVIFRPIDALYVLCAQLTRDLFATAKFLFFYLSFLWNHASCVHQNLRQNWLGQYVGMKWCYFGPDTIPSAKAQWLPSFVNTERYGILWLIHAPVAPILVLNGSNEVFPLFFWCEPLPPLVWRRHAGAVFVTCCEVLWNFLKQFIISISSVNTDRL